nr:hypothetical protein [Roseiconus nitratireducens]
MANGCVKQLEHPSQRWEALTPFLMSDELVKESPEFRKRLIGGLECFDIHLDEQLNGNAEELTQPTRLNRIGVTIAFLAAQKELQMARAVFGREH